jgi:hypothetical protein
MPAPADKPAANPANSKRDVSLAVAISFVLTLGVSLFFKMVLGQGLSSGIPFVAALTFLVSFAVIFLLRRRRGTK